MVLSLKVIIVVILALALGAAPVDAADVAVIRSRHESAWAPVLQALRASTPSHNVSVHDLDGDMSRSESVTRSLAGRVAVIVAMGPLAAQSATAFAPDTPMVYCMVDRPAAIDLLDTPNVAGVAARLPVKNQLAAFRMINPWGVRVAVIYNPANTGELVAEARAAAPVVRLLLIGRKVTSADDVPVTLNALLKDKNTMDALWVPPDPMLLGEDTRSFIVERMMKARKPIYSSVAQLVAEGALVGQAPDPVSIGRQAGELVNRMAGGQAREATLRIPRNNLFINAKSAKRLKIKVPPSMLQSASQVY